MPINPDAVGATSEPTRHSWTSKDALLYAVGVGAGHEPLEELQYTTENSADIDQKVLPTMAVVLGGGGSAMRDIGSFNPAMLVHGEQAITLHREIPVEGEIETIGEVTGIWDKGKGAVVVTESTSRLVGEDGTAGEPLFTKMMSAFIRGEGGWGGDSGPALDWERPEGDPDETVTFTTRPEQALIYRLSGDRNPLHADPTFAAMGGFDRPILHGLCTYGFTGRGLLRALCDGDSARFAGMYGRFSSPVLPGEDLTVHVWRTGDGEAVYQTTGSDGRVVLDKGTCEYRV